LPLAPELREIQAAARRRDPLRRTANPELVAAIQAARNKGWTCETIGDLLGVSRQAISAPLVRHDSRLH
jgi:hypothetical protein